MYDTFKEVARIYRPRLYNRSRRKYLCRLIDNIYINNRSRKELLKSIICLKHTKRKLHLCCNDMLWIHNIPVRINYSLKGLSIPQNPLQKSINKY